MAHDFVPKRAAFALLVFIALQKSFALFEPGLLECILRRLPFAIILDLVLTSLAMSHHQIDTDLAPAADMHKSSCVLNPGPYTH